jgi:cobalamin biosynthetic protein CobC
MKTAAKHHERLAQHGVFVRLLDQKDGLRFGLPAGESAFKRLEQALSEYV